LPANELRTVDRVGMSQKSMLLWQTDTRVDWMVAREGPELLLPAGEVGLKAAVAFNSFEVHSLTVASASSPARKVEQPLLISAGVSGLAVAGGSLRERTLSSSKGGHYRNRNERPHC
jgi:hypothetical protein